MAAIGRRSKINVVVTADGDYFIVTTVCETGTVTVDGTATALIGREDSGGNFVAYLNSAVDAGGKLVNHGLGERLMVRISGIAATVTIGYAPGC